MRFFIYVTAAGCALFCGWLWWAGNALNVATYWAPKVNWKLEKAAQWGDAFGAFNALVSALGFAAVLITLVMQSRSVKDQANDLHKQRFESTYFELLRLLADARERISFEHSSEYNARMLPDFMKESPSLPMLAGVQIEKAEHIGGHHAIRAALRELRFWLAPKRNARLGRDGLKKIYEEKIHKSNEFGFGPYFRLIYTILNRLREDKILTDVEKASYGNLLRSQLTSEEISLLAVNALAPFAKDLETLIIEFRMLKYVPESSLKRRLRAVYGELAFQSRD